jgi:succinylglutamate desuccinylase
LGFETLRLVLATQSSFAIDKSKLTINRNKECGRMPLFSQSFLHDTLDNHRLTGRDTVTEKSITLDNLTNVSLLESGYLLIEPARMTPDTKHIVISSGVHGDETAPMESVNQLVTDILTGKVESKHRLLVFFGHPEATLSHSRFVVENLNRLFGDAPDYSNKETAIALRIKQHIDAFFAGTDPVTRWHFDLHCAIRGSKHYTFAVSPKTLNPTRSQALVEFMDAAKLEAVLLSNSPSPTCSWYSAENHSAQAVTVELGQVAPLWQNDLARIQPFFDALTCLITDRPLPPQPQSIITYRVNRTITRHFENFQFNFAKDVENFTSFELGDVLGHDGEQILTTKVAHEAVVFPNPNVVVGQRAALMVCKVATRYENQQLVYDA